ncbi:DUF4827 domain-containing protein [Panacibacter ginsenosidivorans]|uniref:DUF4827 domain-containing protein n=1 Tax=Panacibacter ginsenosidivorans TaxID=1813871 RepID=A0A5B8V4X3_9BACT|nr:DUF4827 domain-containing protein [Panacibacter ginsenosidivorans]QEC66430.1 DUF4827 domain-containing protein [Panacibacter ginsenosidivorans]
MMPLKKLIFLVVLLIAANCAVKSQSLNKTFKVYIKENGLKSISKEEFLKLDSVTVEPKNYYHFTFTIIVTDGKGWFQYVMTKGTKIDPKVKEWYAKEIAVSLVWMK